MAGLVLHGWHMHSLREARVEREAALRELTLAIIAHTELPVFGEFTKRVVMSGGKVGCSERMGSPVGMAWPQPMLATLTVASSSSPSVCRLTLT